MNWRKALEEEREGERTDAELNRDLWRKKRVASASKGLQIKQGECPACRLPWHLLIWMK